MHVVLVFVMCAGHRECICDRPRAECELVFNECVVFDCVGCVGF